MFQTVVLGQALAFETSPALFSPNGIDAGTLALLSAVRFSPGDKVLDLGCGWGAAGIAVARLLGPGGVTLCDIDPGAVACARKNAALNGVPALRVLESDGYDGLDDTGYSLILSNPPYHANFSVPKRFIEGGFRRLAPGGRLYMVTKRREWYKNKFIAVFGGVQIEEINGYHVFCGEKRPRPRRDAPL